MPTETDAMSLGACPRLVPVMVICVPPSEGPARGVICDGVT